MQSVLLETEKLTQPESIWAMLEMKNYAGQHDSQVVLLSAAWLRTQRTFTRLPERSKLPPEALIPLRSLRAIHATIEKGMAKNMSKPLPIICILHPRPALGKNGAKRMRTAHASSPTPLLLPLPQLRAPLQLRTPPHQLRLRSPTPTPSPASPPPPERG